MNKASVLRAPSWAHQGEFIASGTIFMFQACIEDTHDVTSAEGMTYVQNVHKLKAMSTAGQAADSTGIVYLTYKWPTEDDYLGLNGLSAEYMVKGEGVIGLKMIAGVRVQDYVGTDYTNAAGVKMGSLAPGITWSSVTAGTQLYFTDIGQLTTATTNSIVRAQFIEEKLNWVTYEIV
jgi:hypothetical protein